MCLNTVCVWVSVCIAKEKEREFEKESKTDYCKSEMQESQLGSSSLNS